MSVFTEEQAPARAVYGRQEFTFSYMPESYGTVGPSAREWLTGLGVNLFPYQEILFDFICTVKADGSPAYKKLGNCTRRQIGKSEILVCFILYRLFFTERDPNKPNTPLTHVLSSLGQRSGGMLFERLVTLIESNPELSAMTNVKAYRGAEEVKITSGPRKGDRIVFNVRSANSGRGFGSVATLLIDESNSITEASFNSLSRTTATVNNSVILYFGTVPSPEVDDMDIYRSVRDIGRRGDSGTVAWCEWSGGPWDYDEARALDVWDDQIIIDSTPALGYIISWETAEADREEALYGSESMQDAWRREAVSIWPNAAEIDYTPPNNLDMDAWRAGEVEHSPDNYTGPWAVALCVYRPLGTVAIHGATMYADGRVLLEDMGLYTKGVEVLNRLEDLRSKINIQVLCADTKNIEYFPQVHELLTDKYNQEVPVTVSNFEEKNNAGKLVHHPTLIKDKTLEDDRRADTLEKVMEVAEYRTSGKGEFERTYWGAQDGNDDQNVQIDIIKAASMALYAIENIKPKRKTYSYGY